MGVIDTTSNTELGYPEGYHKMGRERTEKMAPSGIVKALRQVQREIDKEVDDLLKDAPGKERGQKKALLRKPDTHEGKYTEVPALATEA